MNKKKRVLNVCSLLMNLLIVIFTISATYYNFRTDVIRDPIWFGYTGWNSMVFFTTLSNVFVAITAMIVLVYNIKNVINDSFKFPKIVILLKYIATIAVTVTILTVAFFLAPMYAFNGYGYFWLFTKNNIFMHLLTPLLAIFSFILCEYNSELKKRDTFLGMIPVFLYSIVYCLMVVAFKKWDDFYGFTFGGKYYLFPIVAIVMYGATYLFSFLIYLLQKKINDKK